MHDDLTTAQRNALGTAFGLTDGPADDSGPAVLPVHRAVITIGGEASPAEDEDDALAPLPDRLMMELTAHRTLALRDAVATWYKSWFPRVAEANGRKFVHELDDVKDHVPDRTIDMSYLVDRELHLPFGEWVTAIQAARNQFAATNHLAADTRAFHWPAMEPGR